jgi:hypothetical protein
LRIVASAREGSSQNDKKGRSELNVVLSLQKRFVENLGAAEVGATLKMQSPFEQHRDLLAALASDDVLLPLLSEAAARRSWWQADRTWKRTFGSFDPSVPAMVTLLFESEAEPQEICHVEIFAAKPEATSDAEFVIAHEAFGWPKPSRKSFA